MQVLLRCCVEGCCHGRQMNRNKRGSVLNKRLVPNLQVQILHLCLASLSLSAVHIQSDLDSALGRHKFLRLAFNFTENWMDLGVFEENRDMQLHEISGGWGFGIEGRTAALSTAAYLLRWTSSFKAGCSFSS